jgi:hypothetical protein
VGTLAENFDNNCKKRTFTKKEKVGNAETATKKTESKLLIQLFYEKINS